MGARLDRTLSVSKAVVHELRAEKITFMAGSIAYHAVLSTLPLLLVAIVILSAVGDQSLQSGFIDAVGAAFTPETETALVRELEAAQVSTGVSLLGAIVLLWGTLRIFRCLDTAFSDVYDTGARDSVVDQFVDAAVVLVSFGVAVAGAWVLGSVFPSGDAGPLAWLSYRVALVSMLAVTFFPMYYVFPDANVTAREVLPGVFAAAFGLMVFASLFRFYIELSSPDAGTVIAGVIVLLTWLYFSSLVLLLGAVLNAVLSNRSLDVDIDPVVGGVESDREHLTARLRETEAALHGATELVMATGETEVHLPSPRHVRVDAEGAALSLEGRTIGLELRWAPREATDE